MAACQMCGKIGGWGHNVSHSKRRTNTRWRPNVQRVSLRVNGKTQRQYVCTRCLRTYQGKRLEA